MKPETMSSKTGPYTVEESGCVYVIMGPDGRWPFHFTNEGIAKIRANDLNIAYMAGQESRWIPVSERKPDHIRHIAMLFPDNRVVTGGYLPTFDTWMDDGQGELEAPTHWFYIPEAPNT